MRCVRFDVGMKMVSALGIVFFSGDLFCFSRSTIVVY